MMTPPYGPYPSDKVDEIIDLMGSLLGADEGSRCRAETQLGGLFANLVVVPPQVAILGVGRMRSVTVVKDGVVTARQMLPLSLTFDHRAVSGGEAARFLAAVKATLEGSD